MSSTGRIIRLYASDDVSSCMPFISKPPSPNLHSRNPISKPSFPNLHSRDRIPGPPFLNTSQQISFRLLLKSRLCRMNPMIVHQLWTTGALYIQFLHILNQEDYPTTCLWRYLIPYALHSEAIIPENPIPEPPFPNLRSRDLHSNTKPSFLRTPFPNFHPRGLCSSIF